MLLLTPHLYHVYAGPVRWKEITHICMSMGTSYHSKYSHTLNTYSLTPSPSKRGSLSLIPFTSGLLSDTRRAFSGMNERLAGSNFGYFISRASFSKLQISCSNSSIATTRLLVVLT
ncbi:hypothetical protein AAHE18_20G193000 [Arachis hypogaea]